MYIMVSTLHVEEISPWPPLSHHYVQLINQGQCVINILSIRRQICTSQKSFSTRLYRVRNPILLLTKNSTTPVYRLCVVLQLNLIHFNGTKLPYQTQPMDRCGAVSGKKQPCFPNAEQPLKGYRMSYHCIIYSLIYSSTLEIIERV